MEKGEAIMNVKVTGPGEDIGLTTRLEKGMRAFAIKVDVASGVSGFLRPGDRVDIYWSGQANGNDVTKLIEDSISLIAVDQTDDMIDGARIARTVTVAATPVQVASLAQAQSTGNLSLSLVGAGDDTVVSNIEVDQVSLLGLEVAAPVQAAPAERTCCHPDPPWRRGRLDPDPLHKLKRNQFVRRAPRPSRGPLPFLRVAIYPHKHCARTH